MAGTHVDILQTLSYLQLTAPCFTSQYSEGREYVGAGRTVPVVGSKLRRQEKNKKDDQLGLQEVL